MEIRLTDITGRIIVLKERVAVSDRVHQPILCFGRLLENGEPMEHSKPLSVIQVHIPIELQKKSMVVQGVIRALRLEPSDVLNVSAVQAEVMDDVLNGSVGWQLDSNGCGIGRHSASNFQDPTLMRPDLHGRLYRTTLAQGNDKKWYVLELCERMDELVQLDASFHEFQGERNVITMVIIITDGEKDAKLMGFSMLDDDIAETSEAAFPVVPE